MVEAGHQQHVTAGILNHHKGCVGDGQRVMVVAFNISLCVRTQVLQAQLR